MLLVFKLVILSLSDLIRQISCDFVCMYAHMYTRTYTYLCMHVHGVCVLHYTDNLRSSTHFRLLFIFKSTVKNLRIFVGL